MNSVHEQFMNCSRIIRELQNNISQGLPYAANIGLLLYAANIGLLPYAASLAQDQPAHSCNLGRSYTGGQPSSRPACAFLQSGQELHLLEPNFEGLCKQFESRSDATDPNSLTHHNNSNNNMQYSISHPAD
ncbi:hypothetical protein DPMN_020262 [Dreissena polymorpha]|uniref:Uncharacterized protein n=1 Tax=Dreissena polymorpha TaxID=45954 RepID=A0A9D4NM83_DREPO|nr:hypothetical protein DPMN_020262 [Dreissena polymorpha]